MLDFANTERNVQTMSAAQVRRPMSSSGVRAWKPYERFLAVAVDDAAEALSLSKLLGHGWRDDPPHLQALVARGLIAPPPPPEKGELEEGQGEGALQAAVESDGAVTSGDLWL